MELSNRVIFFRHFSRVHKKVSDLYNVSYVENFQSSPTNNYRIINDQIWIKSIHLKRVYKVHIFSPRNLCWNAATQNTPERLNNFSFQHFIFRVEFATINTFNTHNSISPSPDLFTCVNTPDHCMAGGRPTSQVIALAQTSIKD